VATALMVEISLPAKIAAAPPRECPTMSVGALWVCSRYAAALNKSCTLLEKFVSAKSPSLSPKPVKSKRSTPKPSEARALLTLRTALKSLEHVKQWAKIAKLWGSWSAGRSNFVIRS